MHDENSPGTSLPDAFVTGTLPVNLDANQQGTQNKWSLCEKIDALGCSALA
jgi:hypothetical protein